MKKQYTSTIEEATYVIYRINEILGTVKRYLWYGTLGITVCVALALLALNAFLPASLWRFSWLVIYIGLLAIAVHLWTHKHVMRAGARKLIVKARGSDQPVPAEFEVDDESLWFRALGQELRFLWSSVREVRDIPTGIEVIMQPLGVAVIPNRIFANDEERHEWTEFIRAHAGCGTVDHCG